jgi:hypothetical protein
MSKANTKSDIDGVKQSITTDVYHDGDEVAVRARSKYSRSSHEPITDSKGNVVFYAPTEDDEPGPVKVVGEDHDDAEPRPACGLPTGDVHGTDFRLATTHDVSNRPACSYCTGTNGDPSKGSGKKSFARRMRYGDDWGDD